MAKVRNIKLVDLLINTENYRFEPAENQREAIETMITDQKSNLFDLTENIVANGLNPNDHIQVIKSNHDPRKFIVLEGNRRVVSLKLLANPDLIDDADLISLKRKFSKLKSANLRSFSTIGCLEYSDPKEAELWIAIKHGYGRPGVSTVPWNPHQKDRFKEATEGKSSIVRQTVRLLEKSSSVDGKLRGRLRDIPLSSLKRLISDPEVRSFLGVRVNNGNLESTLDEGEVVKGLSRIAEDLLDPRFKVAKIYTKDDRRDYIDEFPVSKRPNLKKTASLPWQLASPRGPNRSTGRLRQTNPENRKTLIPRSFAVSIGNGRVHRIYEELKGLDVIKFTNATAVLLRVFVELSIDCYIENKKIAKTPSAAKSGLDLRTKVTRVADHMRASGWSDAAIAKGIKVAVKNEHHILGIDTLHSYLHNHRISPSDKDLIRTWDSLEDFMRILWENVD